MDMKTNITMRNLFVAPPGYVWLSCDFSSQELLCVGALSGEPNMLSTFARKKWDPYIKDENGDSIKDPYTDLHYVAAESIKPELKNLPISKRKEAAEDKLPELGNKSPRAVGKAQPLSEPVMTVNGPVEMGSINVGDYVIGSDGKATKVLGVYPQGLKKIYRVTFSDETSTRCCEEHLWSVKSKYWKSFKTRSLKDLHDYKIKRSDGGVEYKYHIPISKAVEWEGSQDLPIHPYVLGCLIGDGHLNKDHISLACWESFIKDKFQSFLPAGIELRPLKNRPNVYHLFSDGKHHQFRADMKLLGLIGARSWNKFIPNIYKMASVEDRLFILQGLLDTDGYVSKDGVVQFNSASEQLCDDVRFIVESLGGICYKSSKSTSYICKGERREGRTSFVLTIRLDGMKIVSLPRKVERLMERKPKKRWITNIEECGVEDCQCIKVEADDSLYLTNHFIVTHNTLNFGLIYGLTASSLANDMGWETKHAESVLDSYFDKFNKLKSWLDLQSSLGKERKWVRTASGRVCFTAESNAKGIDDANAYGRKATNCLVQGACSDMMKLALRKIHPFAKENGCKLVSVVHDNYICRG